MAFQDRSHLRRRDMTNRDRSFEAAIWQIRSQSPSFDTEELAEQFNEPDKGLDFAFKFPSASDSASAATPRPDSPEYDQGGICG